MQTEPIAIAIHKTRFRGFKLCYENAQATESMIRAIDEFPSFFTPKTSEPLIIDCGANIGVSVLEWKTRWPMARILCFEPDPEAFRLLSMNMDLNDVPGVKCINAAVANFDGTTTLFGDLGRTSDARGNSIEAAWGQRPGTSTTEVPCQRLSPHLNGERVAFLKMDIEGAEEQVLRETAAHLHRVDALYVEVHETDELAATNSAARICHLLTSAGFTVESERRFEPHALPAHLDSWREAVHASQTQLLCWR